MSMSRKLEGRDENKRRSCVQKSRPPIADDNVGARVRKELSFRFVYWIHYSVRPGWKQLLFDKYVDTLEEPGFVFRSFSKLDKRICVKDWLRDHDLVLVLAG